MNEDVIGSRGMVITAIPGKERPGEVQIHYAGGSTTLIAYADEPIARGAAIVVYEVRPGRCVSVAPTS